MFYDVGARYIFIFWLKNPGAVNDDFWTWVINFQLAGISIIANFIIFSLPGWNNFRI
jgi:hypothetical protein